MGRKAEDLATRFERLVDRTGEHHLWLGSVNPERGTGRMKVDNVERTAHRVAWELARGALSSKKRVLTCESNPACVRVEHLRLERTTETSARRAPRARKGTGSMRLVRAGTWELRVTIGRWGNGRPRSFTSTVRAKSKAAAAGLLADFVEETSSSQLPETQDVRDMTIDEALNRYLDEYLATEKGRAEKTISDYRYLHQRWFSSAIGKEQVKRIESATMDKLFGTMRQAGLSASRLNQAKSLYVPFFRWAKRRGMTTRNPMADFQMPTSTFRSQERTPPEVEELSLLLSTAVEETPDIAPLLVLAAVTGIRRGELVGIPMSAVDWKRNQITVASAISSAGKVKATKTRQSRTFHIDTETVAMLKRHCDEIKKQAAEAGTELAADRFLFSLALDYATPMPPDHLTKRVAALKGYLGIENKDPEVVALEDEALRLRRSTPPSRPAGRPGPLPTGGLSYREIGKALGRSERWASLAVAAAERREMAHGSGRGDLDFDGSILALRKFTSSELLDAGFNINVVAERQGHGPQVLTRHYSKSRASSDKRAAEHLGRVVHRKDALAPEAQARSDRDP
ncbi:MAG TPA: site-specific integrase [Acidimicrobiales bacterium]